MGVDRGGGGDRKESPSRRKIYPEHKYKDSAQLQAVTFRLRQRKTDLFKSSSRRDGTMDGANLSGLPVVSPPPIQPQTLTSMGSYQCRGKAMRARFSANVLQVCSAPARAKSALCRPGQRGATGAQATFEFTDNLFKSRGFDAGIRKPGRRLT